MALSAFDLAQLRTYVAWDPPTDATLEEAWEALDAEGIDPTWQRIARDQVRAKLSELLGKPASWSAGGDYAENWSANVQALQRSLADLEEQLAVLESDDAGAVNGVGVGRAQRADRSRSPLPRTTTEVGPLLG